LGGHLRFTVPAEWAPHRAMWLGFPSHAELWQDDLDAAQAEVAALARALAGPGGERVRLMTGHPRPRRAARPAGRRGGRRDRAAASSATSGCATPARSSSAAATAAARPAGFRFNGWGGKYSWSTTTPVAEQIAAAAGAPLAAHDFVLEGGAVDHDGLGTVLTTRQCLLNPNRNPAGRGGGRGRAAPSASAPRRCCGWARACRTTTPTATSTTWPASSRRAWSPARWPGAATTPTPRPMTTPPRLLAGMTDARARRCKVVRIPSPGWIEGEPTATADPGQPHELPDRQRAVIVPIYEPRPGRPSPSRRWSTCSPTAR
jgi:agmatine deiminase